MTAFGDYPVQCPDEHYGRTSDSLDEFDNLLFDFCPENNWHGNFAATWADVGWSGGTYYNPGYAQN